MELLTEIHAELLEEFGLFLTFHNFRTSGLICVRTNRVISEELLKDFIVEPL